VLQRVAVCCSVLQCVAVCCSVLQCAAVCCSVLPFHGHTWLRQHVNARARFTCTYVEVAFHTEHIIHIYIICFFSGINRTDSMYVEHMSSVICIDHMT